MRVKDGRKKNLRNRSVREMFTYLIMLYMYVKYYIKRLKIKYKFLYSFVLFRSDASSTDYFVGPHVELILKKYMYAHI